MCVCACACMHSCCLFEAMWGHSEATHLLGAGNWRIQARQAPANRRTRTHKLAVHVRACPCLGHTCTRLSLCNCLSNHMCLCLSACLLACLPTYLFHLCARVCVCVREREREGERGREREVFMQGSVLAYSAIHFPGYNIQKWCPADLLVSGSPRVTGWPESMI